MSSEVEILQAKLDAFLRIAKNNEQKQRNFQQYELSLLTSSGLYELLSIILEQHREKFQLTEVTLLLLDPEYEFRRLLDSFTLPRAWKGRLLFTDSAHELSQHFQVPRKVRLSVFSAQHHQALFPNYTSNSGSVAILPLIRENSVIGSVNLASRQTDRFQPGIGTQFLQHLSAIISASIENTRLQESVKQLGLRDPLTGINNRRFFDQRIDEEVSLAQRNKTPLSCLFIDLDHFKRINDNHGHHAGDLVLKQSSQIFNETMRTSDVLARYGGEEFVILLANTSSQAAYEIAERIRSKIANTDFAISSTQSLNVTLSIGLATLDVNNGIHTTQQLINSADQAVYVAKESGRNRVHHAN
jgi:diguanylate cyclase (GGDEF)-like protein